MSIPTSLPAWLWLSVALAGCVVEAEPDDALDDDDELGELGAPLNVTCEVVIAGGSTAALAAALTSAREGADTCLLEPVDWPGGQLTASGVPAIDWAWHKVGALDVAAIARQPINQPAELSTWMAQVGNPGNCWVSRNCFRPDTFVADVLRPAIADEPKLRVFYNTVVKQAHRTGARVERLTAIRRTLRPGQAVGYLSAELADWYSPTTSARYTKEVLTVRGQVFVDATELGDVLALADAPYLQGVETVDGSFETRDDRCGQATVFPLIARYHATAQSEPASPLPVDHPSFYGLGRFTWDQVWSYRRVVDAAGGLAGDYSLQNWNPGNDYAFGYLLTSRAATAAQRGDWRGGVDLDALAGAERHALGWYGWLEQRAPDGPARVTLDRTLLGSPTGLAKLPYVRDTRRSVGLEGFVLGAGHLRGEAAARTGTRFKDRVAIGAYAIDVHPLQTCTLPGYVTTAAAEPLPFYIPLRALTNRDVENLLVAGKTMAQSFVANAATRLQPIEWSSGVGAGAAAAHMVRRGLTTTRAALDDVAAIQARIRPHAPLEWTIDGVAYPRPTEVTPPIATDIACPTGARYDWGYGFCVSGADAYGPFTRAMTDRCVHYGGGPACTATHAVTVAGRTLALPRWSKSFAHAIRGDTDCPRGAARDPELLGHCAERYWDGARWVHDVYGPFGADLVARCVAAQGGSACYTHRWSAAFFRSLAP